MNGFNHHIIQSFNKTLNISFSIHTGTSDATRSTSREILNEPFKLKTLVKQTLSETDVTFSAPILRSDNGKAALMVRKLCTHLVKLKLHILDHRNITDIHLSRKKFQLVKTTSIARLAKTITEILMVFGTINGISNESLTSP